ncbi:polysaccharide deacetylase family protein [Allorhizobium undicola]|uniref:polysaccharide deacetylase family protein n=1 Tax=Allorhizobium undicola TaxID=78527 RepID=UPI0004897615|nr:polysaccharide deacetylase family protein [Allorhizobium undicola]
MGEKRFRQALARAQEQGKQVRFWWRDDDAVAPGPALDELIELARKYRVPVTLAVIPAPAGEALAERVRNEPMVGCALHGWSHENHAGAGEKKQELGAHRAASDVLGELSIGLTKLESLFGPSFHPMLVPPWNRISPALVPHLSGIGIRALSVFGAERPDAALPLFNTHVDVMDWHGTRGGRDAAMLFDELADWMERDWPLIGLLTHHLVHDDAAWQFLDRLFCLTGEHPACIWLGCEDLMTACEG